MSFNDFFSFKKTLILFVKTEHVLVGNSVAVHSPTEPKKLVKVRHEYSIILGDMNSVVCTILNELQLASPNPSL